MKMAAQKSCPSFASIISVLSIVLYCGGFLRVELELNKQRKRIDALETDTQVKPSPKDPDITKIVMNSPELLGNGIHRNRRHVYRTKNETEKKQTSDEGLKTDHLLSDLRLKLCQSNIDKCSAGPPGPPGPPGPRGEIGVRGRRGQKGRTGNKGNNGIMGSPGKSGKQGPKGEIGPEGQKGETGTEGTPGPKGNKGVMGSPGGSGKQGIMGLPGTKGKTGPKGQKGEIGTEGMPGAKGSKGVTGSPGRIGKQGIIGLLGPKGEPGAKGEKGVTGTQGMPGAKGSKGVMGSPGRSGKQGSMGLLGPKGEPGPKGQKGGTGTTGILRSSSILNSLDSKYAFELNSFLGPVLRNPSRSMFVRCWRAKTDGWAATTFHRNCDAKGPTVTIIKVGSYIFGGYTDVSWSSPSSCDWASSSKSFIYSLYNINGYTPVKLQVKSGQKSRAINRCSSYGPTFGGGHGIHISNNAASNRNSYTDCGWSYPLPPGYSSFGTSCRFYAGGESFNFTPTDVEVFYETTT